MNVLKSKTSDDERNWAGFDKDLLSLIFQKVGAIDVLMRAQYVCKPWRNISFDPRIWKVIDMTTLHGDNMNLDLEKITTEAIDRSDGQLEELWIAYFGSDSLLSYVENRGKMLRRLRIIAAPDISDDGLCEMLKQLPYLEDFELTFGYSSLGICEEIGKACPNLKRFRFNDKGNRYVVFEHDEDAIGIASNMPELRSLQLIGNNLTNKGLNEILDKCKHLERLDVRCCFSLNMVIDPSLKAKCARLKEMRLPDDSTEDYEFVAEVSWGQSYEIEYGDDDLYAGFSDVDLMYDDLSFDGLLGYDFDDLPDYGPHVVDDEFGEMFVDGGDGFDGDGEFGEAYDDGEFDEDGPCF